MANPKLDVYRDLFGNVHYWMEGTTGDLTAESAAWPPPGRVVPAGAHYVHHLLAEDFILNVAVQNKTPLVTGDFAGKAGFDKEYPMTGPWTDWARTVKIDLPQSREYAQAVYANTDACLAALSDSDLTVEHDYSAVGFGTHTLGYLINQILTDGAAHAGEISAIKGLQDLQGYPF